MKKSIPHHHATMALAIAAIGLLPMTALAQSTPDWDSGRWRVAASLYGYLPSIGGSVVFPAGGASTLQAAGDSSINIDADKILDNLKFTFMGSLDVHNGRWGLFNDVLYLDLGNSKSQTRDFSIGGALPATATADLSFDLKGLIWTVAGEYRVASSPQWTMDVLAGARLIDLKPKVNWSLYGDVGAFPARNGSAEVSKKNWDGIVGLKGRYAFGESRAWNVPFYVDVGTGESDLTWQAAIGLGYSFGWGDVVAMYRYLKYEFSSTQPVADMDFSGPMVGVTFRW